MMRVKRTPPSLPALAAALAYAESSDTVWESVELIAANRTLAAAVRSLVAERDTFYMGYRVETDKQLKEWDLTAQHLLTRAERAEADLAALKGRACATWARQVHDGTGEGCGRTEIRIHIPGTDPFERGTVHRVRCADLGNTCGAYSAKESTP